MAAIPDSCFERDLKHALWYVLRSLVFTVGTGYLAWAFFPALSLTFVSIALWSVYALVNGTIAMGLWVLAHECGHGAFCKNKTVADTIGYVLHSALLVPYFSWQRSHALHHAYTNHMGRDVAFVPGKVDSAIDQNTKMIGAGNRFAVTYNVIMHLFRALILGWPLYLFTGITGSPDLGKTNHFLPTNDRLFPNKWKRKVLFSTLGLVVVLSCLYAWVYISGSWGVVLGLYAGPLVVVNAWLMLYTWLHHTDIDVPHYDKENWTWVKGATATVDRAYPRIINYLHYNLGNTHLLHHLCHKVPHYHAEDAQEAIKKAFPNLHLYDPTPVLASLWRVAKTCQVVSKNERGAWWYN